MILINLVRFDPYLVILMCCLASWASAQPAVIIDAKLVSGGHVIIKTSPHSQISFLDQLITSDKAGYVAIGFGRDIGGLFNINIESSDDVFSQLPVFVASRKFVIQRINGIKPKFVDPPDDQIERIMTEDRQVKKARSSNSQLTYWRDQPFIAPANGVISGVYGSQRFYNDKPANPHWGIDFAAPSGAPVIAPAGGRVVLAESNLFFSGGTIILDHGGGLTSSFLHLSKLHVSQGDMVEQGVLIAEVGSTGRSTGPHLDWRMNLHGVRVDAALWLPGTP